MGKEEREARKKARREAAEAKKMVRQEATEKRKQAIADARAARAIRATESKSRALGFLQVAWVTEILVIIPTVLIYLAVLPQWRIELMGKVLVPLIGSILGEAGIAFGGPLIKKWLRGKYGKLEEQ